MVDNLFQNKYRILPVRAAWWDYGNCEAYFVTICTKNKAHFFGKITENQSTTSDIGQLATTHWQEIPQRFPYAQLGVFVVMPNHVHGINLIEKLTDLLVETRFIASEQSTSNSQTNETSSITPTKARRYYR